MTANSFKTGESLGHSEKNVFDGIAGYNNSKHMSYSIRQVTKEEEEKKYLEDLRKRTLQKSMSYANALIFLNRIVMSSDSRTIIERDGNILKYNDNFQKIVYLPLLKVGLVTTGVNMIDNIPITDFLLQHDEESTGTVSEKLENIALLLQQHMPEQEDIYINIECGGFKNGKAALFYTDVTKEQGCVIHKTSLMWEAGAVRKASQMFRENFKTNSGICTISGEIKADFCSAKDMIDFSEFLVRTNMFVDKKINGIPVTGGPVQTLLLENSAAKWIHPLY